jgi:hypothetical protein
MSRIVPAVATLACIASPLAAQSARVVTRPADHAGVYKFEAPTNQRDATFDMMKQFAYVRLERDGRMRMEEITLDTRGERLAPSVRVSPWSTERWGIRPATDGRTTFCMPAPGGVEVARGSATPAPPSPARDSLAPTCFPYERDGRTGDLVIRLGGDRRLALRRVVR